MKQIHDFKSFNFKKVTMMRFNYRMKMYLFIKDFLTATLAYDSEIGGGRIVLTFAHNKNFITVIHFIIISCFESYGGETVWIWPLLFLDSLLSIPDTDCFISAAGRQDASSVSKQGRQTVFGHVWRGEKNCPTGRILGILQGISNLNYVPPGRFHLSHHAGGFG